MKGKFIGVISPLAFETTWYPKRLMLMFDGLAIDLSSQSSGYENYILNKSKNVIEKLTALGVLTTLSGLIVKNISEGERIPSISSTGSFLLPSDIRNDYEKFVSSPALGEIGLGGLRYSASELRKLKGIDAVAIGTSEQEEDIDATVHRTSVIRITLSEFPMPSDQINWENIIEFKSKTESQLQFQQLKVWMNKISKSGLKEYELKDELLEMINSYKQKMELSKMKYQKGFFEVLLTTTAEVAENIIKIKPSLAVKSIFTVAENKIKLLEEEQNIIGKEIAYVVSAKAKFL